MNPYGRVPEWLLDSDASDKGIRLYATLSRYGNGTGQIFPGIPELAERMGCSEDSIMRAIKELENVEALTVKRGRGRGHSNRYHLTGDDTPRKPRTGAAFTSTKRPQTQPIKPRTHAALQKEDRTGDATLVGVAPEETKTCDNCGRPIVTIAGETGCHHPDCKAA